LGVGLVAHAAARQPLQVVERFLHTLARESIKRPEQDQVELSLSRVLEQALELFAVAVLAGGPVHVLVDDSPLLRGGELAQRAELIRAILLAVLLADPGVESDPHASILFLKHSFCQRKYAPVEKLCFERGRTA